MRKVVLPSVALLGFALLVTGCAPTTTSSTGALSPATSAAPSTSPQSRVSGTGLVDVCSAVPLAVVVQTTGRSAYTTVAGGTGVDQNAKVYYCQYSDGDISTAESVFTISVYRGGDSTSIMAKLAQALGGASPVSGVGDKAQANDVELDVVYGTDVVVVSDILDPGTASNLPQSAFVALSKRIQKGL
jgi:hypothetical protein